MARRRGRARVRLPGGARSRPGADRAAVLRAGAADGARGPRDRPRDPPARAARVPGRARGGGGLRARRRHRPPPRRRVRPHAPAADRPGGDRLLDLPRRRLDRSRLPDRRRPDRPGLCDRHDGLGELQHRGPDRGRLARNRRLHRQAQPGRRHARLLDVPGRQRRRRGHGDHRRRPRLRVRGRDHHLDRLQHHRGRTAGQPPRPGHVGGQAQPDREHARVLDLPRRRRRRPQRRADRGRLDALGVRHRHHELDRLPDQRRADPGQQARRRRLRGQAQPGRDGAGLRDLPRRQRDRRGAGDRRRPDRRGVRGRLDRLDRLQRRRRRGRRPGPLRRVRDQAQSGR